MCFQTFEVVWKPIDLTADTAKIDSFMGIQVRTFPLSRTPTGELAMNDC